MSTAIFSMYTAEGFAFGADGRQCRADGTVINEDAQKVFSIEEPKRCLGYALAGVVVLTAEDGDTVFDFVSETPKAASFMTTRKPTGLTKYATELAYWLNQRLRNSVSAATRSGHIFRYPDIPQFTYTDQGERGGTIARIFLAGYYESAEGWTMMRFSHMNQALKPPTVTTYPIHPGNTIGYGSRIVADRLYGTQDEEFSSYRRPRREKLEDTTLIEAIDFTRETIRAQASFRARELDPDCCGLIGGKIHVATLTRARGFQWIDPPTSRTGEV